MAEQTIHGQGIDDDGAYKVVRHDRAGKWFIVREGVAAQRVSIRAAVRMADVAYLGRPGGNTFDRLWEAK